MKEIFFFSGGIRTHDISVVSHQGFLITNIRRLTFTLDHTKNRVLESHKASSVGATKIALNLSRPDTLTTLTQAYGIENIALDKGVRSKVRRPFLQ